MNTRLHSLLTGKKNDTAMSRAAARQVKKLPPIAKRGYIGGSDENRLNGGSGAYSSEKTERWENGKFEGCESGNGCDNGKFERRINGCGCDNGKFERRLNGNGCESGKIGGGVWSPAPANETANVENQVENSSAAVENPVENPPSAVENSDFSLRSPSSSVKSSDFPAAGKPNSVKDSDSPAAGRPNSVKDSDSPFKIPSSSVKSSDFSHVKYSRLAAGDCDGDEGKAASPTANEASDRRAARGSTVLMILTDDILPNPMQPRRSFDAEAVARLAESIRLHGIIQPLCVRELEPPSYGYGLIAGERRLRAAKLLGLERVPCIISAADGKRCAELAIVENLQREDLNMFEQAMAIGELMELHCLTQEKIAAELSCSQSYVANKLRLLKLTREDMELILSEGLTERHARTFLRIKDPEARGRAMRTVVRRRMNVAATEEYVDSLLSPKPPKGETAQGKTTVVLRDLRIFHNTLDKALDFIKKAGVPVETVRRDEGEHTEITIRLPRR